MVQWYLYVPAVANLWENVPSVLVGLLSPSPTTLCGTLPSSKVQVTVWPVRTEMVAGVYFRLLMSTVADPDDADGDDAAFEALAPPHAASAWRR